MKRTATPAKISADHPGFSPSAIQEQLERIQNSPEFKATNAQRAFLQYVVERTLAGHSDEIKGYTIATQVFGRRDDFDQATDPIVSIQANKLRRALDYYYLAAGRQDPICITIPKGTYVPVFSGPGEAGTEPPYQQDKQNKLASPNHWPTILVQSFDNLTGDRELDYLGIGIATEIALEITRYQEIRVVRQKSGKKRRRVSDTNARFMLCGSVSRNMAGIKVIVNLIDSSTGIQIWGDSYQNDIIPSRLVSFEEKIASTVVGKISSEAGIIVKTLSLESRRIPPSELKTYDAMLRFYQFVLDFSPDKFMDTFEALELACRNEPECGVVWSMLARLYSMNYSLELMDLDTPIEKAAFYAERGVKLDPANIRTRLVMAFILLFSDEPAAGLAEVDYTLKLNPNSLIWLENIGYLMTLFGDWERGPVLIRKAIKHNPYYNTVVHYALWVDWVRQEKYDEAYMETLHFNKPLLFWDPLMKASILGLLGKIDEGLQAGKDLLTLKPDFHNRGRTLIRHYIKFDDIVEKTIEGLEKVDVHVS